MSDYDTSKKMFWKVEDDIFFNKFDAIAAAALTNKPIKFHLFEEVFDTYNWSKEPKESWEEILKQRAQQIRDTYRYVRLWYSGGVDSHTALMSFVNNKIDLDEIIMIRHSPQGNGFYADTEIEINDVAIPLINAIKNSLGKTKITILDINIEDYDEYSKRDFDLIGWHKFRPSTIREMFWLRPKQLHIKGSICEVRGYEKPRVFIEDNKFYTAMWDATNGLATIGDHNIGNFFISEEMPKVHIKQVHMLKNHLKQHYHVKTNNDILRLDYENYNLKQHVNEICRYPLWKQITLGKGLPGKPTTRLALLKKNTEIHNYQLYDKFMGKMRNQENSKLNTFYNNEDVFKGFSGVLSRKYYLGE